MEARRGDRAISVGTVTSVVLVLILVAGGITALLVFWDKFLRPGDLGAASLPLVALAAGAASTFNPCSLPALPGFLAFSGGGSGVSARRRALLSLATSGGAVTIVIAFGIVVAALGSGTKGAIGPHTRWIQLGVGVFLIALAVLHVQNKTSGLPLVGSIMHMGSRLWDAATGTPSVRSRYLFGVGFVAVGAG